MKNYLLIPLFLLLPFFAVSQNAQLIFAAADVELGNIKSNEITEHKFIASVFGFGEISITKVSTDCACVVSDYSKNVLSAGDTAFVIIKYEPYTLGHFRKTLSVKTNRSKTIELSISGFITPLYTMPSVEFPIKNGNFRTKRKAVNLGIVSNKGVIKREFEIYNNATHPIRFQSQKESPNHIEINFPSAPFIVPPKEKKKISLLYYTEKLQDFGYFTDTVTLFTDDTLSAKIKIPVIATIKQYFPKGIENSSEIPKFSIFPEVINLGNTKLLTDRILQFTIKNQGKTDLIIHKVVSNYGCEARLMGGKNIAPYEKVELAVRIYNTGRKGTQKRYFLLFTNDPLIPIRKVEINVKVLK